MFALIVDCSIVANLEKREIVRGIATLLLQAAKHALSREQLEYVLVILI